MVLGLLSSVGVGIVLARAVDNSENTAYKAGVGTSIIGLPVLLVVGTFMYTIQLDRWDPLFVNLLVSGLGAGIAASVGSVIAIYLTKQQAPSVLD